MGFSLGSWNPRVLFTQDYPKLKRKVKLLTKHLRGNDVFCIQESRGSWAHLLKHCRLILRDYWAKTSFADGYGGIITFVSKKSCPLEESISDIVLCAGRAHRICISGNDSQLVIYNVHNFELHKLVVDNLCSYMDIDIARAKADPLHFSAFVCGDLNASPNSAQLFKYCKPESNWNDSDDDEEPAPRTDKGRILRTLEKFIEIAARAPTRFNKSADTGIILDRVWTLISANYLTLHKVQHTVEQDPKDLFQSGISDHAPITVSITWRTPHARGEGPIASEISRHPLFSHYFLALCWEENFKSLEFGSEFESLLFVKNLMRAAAGFVRDYMHNHMDHLPIIRSQQLTTIARAVWMQSIPLAETLLKHSGFAREHLRISDDKVFIADNLAFSQIADETNTILYSDRASDICAKPKFNERKYNIIANLAKLWIPLNKTLILGGIKVNDHIVRNEPELTIEMGNSWQPTFAPKDFCEQEALNFLTSTEGLGEYADTAPPGHWAIAETMWHAGDSQPGSDGLPYSAWRSTGMTGVNALLKCDQSLRQGDFPPLTLMNLLLCSLLRAPNPMTPSR